VEGGGELEMVLVAVAGEEEEAENLEEADTAEAEYDATAKWGLGGEEGGEEDAEESLEKRPFKIMPYFLFAFAVVVFVVAVGADAVGPQTPLLLFVGTCV